MKTTIAVLFFYLQSGISLVFVSDCFASRSAQFLFSNVSSTFSDAKEFCAGLEGKASLARISSQSEHDLAIYFLSQHTDLSVGAWIGVEDLLGDGNSTTTASFFFVDRDPDRNFFLVEPGSFPWSFNEPNNVGGSEFCVQMVDQLGNVGWNDIDCSRTFPVLCRSQCTQPQPQDD